MQAVHNLMSVIKLSLVALCLVLFSQGTCAQSLGDIFSSVVKDHGPPARPENFKSMREAQEYLAALRDYYSVISRPRFGRSVDQRIQGHAQREVVLPNADHLKL